MGCSGYKIDVALRNPDRQNEFMLAIECDGASYAAQRTVRDRDNLRDSVLKNLGWHTYRAWSTDWCLDRQNAEDELLGFIEKIRSGEDDIQAEEPEKKELVPEDTSTAESTEVQTVQETAHVSAKCKVYRRWNADGVMPQELFYDPASAETIRKQMIQVITSEGPVYEHLLKKRIVSAWGFTRTGDNIRAVLNACLPDDCDTTLLGEDRVFWPYGINAQNFTVYRVSGDADSKRTIDEIPPEEIANAMMEILRDFSSCEQDTLYRETVKLFGFSAVTAKTRKYLDNAMKAIRN